MSATASSGGPAVPLAAAADATLLGAVLFYATFLFVFISLSPFPDLSGADADAGSALNQILALLVMAGAMVFLWHKRAFALAVRPRLWIGLLFAWIALAAMLGDGPFLSIRRLAMAGLVCVAAAAMLHYPKSEDQFARWLGRAILIVIALSYIGVALIPGRAIHQASDFLEPLLAGDWRGHFGHKNTAASVMALAVLIGGYLYARGSRALGGTIVALAGVFLWQSGGKTALGLVPLVLALGHVIENAPRLRAPAVVSALAAFGASTVGLVVWPALQQRLAALGVETTYTGRTNIWALAIDYIEASPIWGYGYQAFWQRPELQYGFREEDTWATMAVDAHNSFIDIALSAGLPGVALLLVWLVVMPLRDLARMPAEILHTPLTRLYLRIWLFVLFLGFLETTFVTSAGPTWFLMLMAVFGLRLQARATLVDRTP